MRIDKFLIPLGLLLSLSGWITSPIALLLGVLIAITFGNSYSDKTKPAASWLMAIAIVGLGAGIPLNEVLKVGAHGVAYTIIGIAFTFAAGITLGKYLSVEKSTSLLVAAGTAICGGSAIAAISKVIDAKSEAIAISLATVFILNAAALVIFPFIGYALELTQSQFGLWAGLAIHDTSSVIGASLQYGDEATKVATMTKLARAIWIIPLAFIVGIVWQQDGHKVPLISILKRCWFIAGFLIMAMLTSYVIIFSEWAPLIENLAKRLMVVVLFLIGTGLTRELLKQVGFRPFIQGSALWILVSAATLAAVIAGWISL